jgi:hypothetical protein
MHRAKLKVLTADREDVYRDIARIPQDHRGEIKEGAICRITREQRSVFVAVRGIGDRKEALIKLDDKTRLALGVETGACYDFDIEPLNWVYQFFAPWHASDPFNRIAMRLSLISLFLGAIGLLLGFLALFG